MRVPSTAEQRALEEALHAIASTIGSTLNLDEVLDRILENLGKVVPHDAANVMLIADGVGHITRARRYFDYPFGDWATRHAFVVADTPTLDEMVRRRRPICIADTTRDPGWTDYFETQWIRSHLGAPIIVDGDVIGIVHANSTRIGAFSPSDAERLQLFADQVAIAIKNAQLYEEARLRNQRLELLNRITRIGTATCDVQEVAREVAETVGQVPGVTGCRVTLWDERQQAAQLIARVGSSGPASAQDSSVTGLHTLTQMALEGRQALVVSDSRALPASPRLLRRQAAMDPGHTTLVLPLRTSEHDIGALLMTHAGPHTFSEEELGWVEQVAELTALIIDKAQAYLELEQRVEARTEELSQANDRLLELTRVKDEFVSNVSHELRTPIASIKLYLHLLGARPDKQIVYLDRLQRETDRLELIIEDLLYLSRVDQGETAPDTAALDLNQLVKEYLADREPLALRRALRLDAALADDLPPVCGDPMSLGRALDVLLTNAMNYTPPGGRVALTTRPEWADGQAYAVLTVSDTGPGIPVEERERVFERFFRGQVGHAAGTPGTGLGLAIAREIVEQHGGRLTLCDDGPAEGEGACFRIVLPAAPGTAG